MKHIVLAGLLASASAGLAFAGEPIGVYVTPYYDSSGPAVRVDPAFDAGLASTDRERLLATIESMRGTWPTLKPATMFVAAIRLYDIGERDEAVRWFYEAQLRARVFHDAVRHVPGAGMGDPVFELEAAHGAFMSLAGEAFNGYGMCDPDKFVAMLEGVRREAATPPDYAAMFPALAFDDIPRHTRANVDGLGGLIAAFNENRALITAERKRNGTDARYCK